MLSLLLAMSAMAETPRAATIPARVGPAAAAPRKRVARKSNARRAPRTAKLCLTGSCAPTVSDRYRLTGASTPRFSGKLDVVESKGLPCGTQGAPVCPGNGTKLVSAPID